MMVKKGIPYEKSFASHEKSKFWSDKNNIKPINVALNSNKNFIFKCGECNHEFITKPNIIVSTNSWCGFCSNKKLCNDNECKKCYEKSFASHPKSKYWNIENKLQPRYVFKGYREKVKFNCFKCNHVFEACLQDVSSGSWCNYCKGYKFCNDNCNICFLKSFASNEKSQFWSPKNKIPPHQVAKATHEKYIFDCKKCGHEFSMSPASINANNWCQYCSIQTKALCNNDTCMHCFNRSFASSPNAKYWHEDNKLKPREVALNSRNKIKFKCEKGHLFESKLNSISGMNTFCPICCNKTEELVFKELQKKYNKIRIQFKAKWCKNNKNTCYLPFDFVLENEKIIIELDGRQHFKQVGNWENPIDIQSRDKYKMQKANENQYSVIRITQEYVVQKNSQWFKELIENIEKVINESKVQNIYICKNNEYDIYINK